MNPYEILGVAETASLSEIKLAYKILAQRSHPDKGGSAEEFKTLQEAYAILKDPNRRETYDRTGEIHEPDNEEQLILSEVMACFDHWLGLVMQNQQSLNSDCIEFMKNKFDEVLRNNRNQNKEITASIEKLEKIQEKFHGENSDFLNGHVSSKLELLKNKQIEISENIEKVEKAKTMTDSMTYDHEKGIQMQYSNTGATGHGTGTTSFFIR